MASERLSDEELERYAVARCLCNGCVKPDARDTGVRMMAAELRDRRAADLTAEERSMVRMAMAMLRESKRGCIQNGDTVNECVAVLDRLLAVLDRLLADRLGEKGESK